LGRAGFLGFSNLSDQDLQAGVLNLAGYPDDKLPLGSLWIDSGPVTPLNREFLHYRIDTGDSQSGSPIWRKVDDQRRVVGIHTGGSPQVNRGVRINSEVFARLLAWRQEE